MLAVIPEALDGGFNRSTFLEIVRERLVEYFRPRVDDEKTVEDAKQALTFQYTPWPHMDDIDEDDKNRQAFNDVTIFVYIYLLNPLHS